MANLIESWSTTASSNGTVGGIDIAENTFARNLNDGVRAVMADVAAWRDATNGVKITTGSANAYVLSSGLSISALAQKVRVTFEANHTNTGASTLALDGLSATDIRRVDGTALTAGDLTAGGIYDVAYESGAAKFLLLNPTPTPTGAGVFTTIELGATDTTLSRVSAGVVAIEGVNILTTATGQGLDATLTALAAYNTNGLLTQTAADTFAGRTLTGTAAQITVTNGDGVAGNPTLSLPADVLIPTVLTVPNTGLHILDSNASHDLIVAAGSDLTADHTLTVTTGDADRTVTLSGNPTLSDWFDQSVKVAATPTFGATTVTGLLTISGASAGQIAFPATQNASADPNTLDDYEEGTFTPSWTSTGSAPAIGDGSLTGTYVVIGLLVYGTIAVVWGGTTTTGTGDYRFSIPFTASGRVGGNVVCLDFNTDIRYLGMASDLSSTTIFVVNSPNSSTGGYLGAASPIATPATDDYIRISFYYLR